jgi:hypothetical protein
MKSTFLNSAGAFLFSLLSFTILQVHAATTVRPFDNISPPHLNVTVNIPATWQSQIVRQDYENESIFSLKTSDKTPAFLFSVTKVTDDQWMTVKNQIKGYTIIENKDGYITFVQKTDVKKIKGQADAQYQQVLGQLDAIVGSIQLN